MNDTDQKKDISTALVRDLAHLQEDRNAQAARTVELLAAYQTEAARAEQQHEARLRIEAERDAQAARAVELLTAYQAEAEAHQETIARLTRRRWLSWFRRR